MTAEQYRDILKNLFLPSLTTIRPNNFKFIQNNYSCEHTARVVKNWMQANNLNVLEHPPKSPDLNSIENIWSMLQKNVNSIIEAPINADDLWDRIETKWEELSVEFSEKLILSMPQGLQIVLEKQGNWTEY